MYEVAMRAIKAGGDPEEMERKQRILQEAAVLGSIGHNFILADFTRKATMFRLNLIGHAATSGSARRKACRCASIGWDVCSSRTFPPPVMIICRVWRG